MVVHARITVKCVGAETLLGKCAKGRKNVSVHSVRREIKGGEMESAGKREGGG